MNDDFTDFLTLLAQEGVEFLVVGGYAYMLHVQSRYTKDLGVWINPTPDNLERLRRACQKFAGLDFRVTDILELLATKYLGFSLLGIEPNKIEILLRIQGIDFAKAYAHGVVVAVRGKNVRFIHPHDQIKNKRATGRLRDLADAEDLVRLHGEPPPEQ